MRSGFQIFKQIFLITLLGVSPWAMGKPFKRVLVLSGGGINPGMSVGIIAGLKEKGWKPDLVIATCGAGIGAMIYNSEQSIKGSFDVLRSWDFYAALSQVRIETANGIEIIGKLDRAKNTARYPDLFEGNLLHAPLEFPQILRNPEFNQETSQTKLIIVSARALFGPDQVGKLREPKPLFQQVYFTDPDTAFFLKGVRVPAKWSYPRTTVTSETLTVSSENAVTAMRAGIADPYLLNPSVVEGFYHFTGAIDLYPLDLATSLGDEVVATYPASLFLEYEDNAVKSGFGFKQTDRVLEILQPKPVKWIDVSGDEQFNFNPSRLLVIMQSGIPSDYSDYRLRVAQQWKFGRERAVEALHFAPGTRVDFRTHLRKPINPKLYFEFSCQNANIWKTDQTEFCASDEASGCDRKSAKVCLPIR